MNVDPSTHGHLIYDWGSKFMTEIINKINSSKKSRLDKESLNVLLPQNSHILVCFLPVHGSWAYLVKFLNAIAIALDFVMIER